MLAAIGDSAAVWTSMSKPAEEVWGLVVAVAAAVGGRDWNKP